MTGIRPESRETEWCNDMTESESEHTLALPMTESPTPSA